MQTYDAIVMSCGAEAPRDLDVPGRELAGIHFAMDYLMQQNKRGAGDDEARAAPRGTITAKEPACGGDRRRRYRLRLHRHRKPAGCILHHPA